MPNAQPVSVMAYWGNDDAESTIELFPGVWSRIFAGGSHIENAVSWYEGESEAVTWTFANGLVSIDGEDGRQCLVEVPIEELYVSE